MMIDVMKIILGVIVILVLPGYIWSYVFFKREELDVLERVAVSIGLSIAIVPLLIFLLNQVFGMKITFTNSLLTLLFFCLSGFALIFLKNKAALNVKCF
jgi:Predicted membrane protein